MRRFMMANRFQFQQSGLKMRVRFRIVPAECVRQIEHSDDEDFSEACFDELDQASRSATHEHPRSDPSGDQRTDRADRMVGDGQPEAQA